MNGVSLGRKALAGLFAFLSVISLGVGVAVFLGFSGNATSSDLARSTRRADCRSAYNADFTEVIRARDDLKLELDSQFYAALLGSAQGRQSSPEDIALFAATKTKLDTARDAVRALPKLDAAVDHGYTLNGETHPPCPTAT